jgi:hypothetical protein
MNGPTRQAGLYAALPMAIALLTASCHHSSDGPGVAGAGPSTPFGQSSSRNSRSDQLLAFSRCMRSHGALQFPDPEPGQTDILLPPANEGIYGVSASRLWPAVSACRHLLPPGQGAWYPRSQIPQVLHALRKFAECMRNHGILNWPDPKFDSQGRLGLPGLGPTFPRGRGRTRQGSNALPCCPPRSRTCSGSGSTEALTTLSAKEKP